MALIGQIAISMVVKTSKLVAGISDAQKAINAFQKSAGTDFGKANKLIHSGLADVSNGVQALGILSGQAFSAMAAAAAKAGPRILDTLGPIKTIALTSADALKYTYGGAAKAIGAGVAKAGGMLAAAVKPSIDSLSYVYGPAFKAIGAGLAKAAVVSAKALTPLAASLGTVAVGLGKVSLGALQAGRGLLKLGAAGALQALRALPGVIGGTVKALRNAVNELGMFAAVGGGIAAFALAKVSKGAMALGEQTDRARVIFGDATDHIIKQSQLMATAFGVSRTESLRFASAFGTIFQGAGYAEKESALLADHFVKLATDLSSLAHIPVPEAMEKLQSGLAGNIRPLRELGISIDEADVKAHAAKMGIAALGTELSQAQKVQSRVSLITERAAKAHGNLALTAGSAANQVRSLTGRWQNLSDTAGTALNTVLAPAISELVVGIEALQTAWDNSALAASSASIGVVGGAQAQTESIGIVQQAIGKIADVWQTVGLAFLYVQEKVTEGLIFMVENVHGFAKGIASIVEWFTGMKVAADDFTAAWLDDLKRMQQAQTDTFTKALAAPAASEGINRAFEAARAKILDARKQLAAQAPADLSKIKPKAQEAMVKGETKFASAAVLGSQEATNAILRSRFGGGKPDKAADKTAENTKNTADNTAKIAEGINKMLSNFAATGEVNMVADF